MGSKKIKRRVTLNVCVGGKIKWLIMKILDLLRSITRRIRKSLRWNLETQIGILNVYKNGHNHAEMYAVLNRGELDIRLGAPPKKPKHRSTPTRFTQIRPPPPPGHSSCGPLPSHPHTQLISPIW